MSNTKYAALIMVAVTILSVSVIIASSPSEGAAGDTARVFIGDGTDSGTREFSGTGEDVESILLDALSSEGLVMNANGTVRSLNGIGNDEDKSWTIYQWRPRGGWEVVVANSTGNAYLDDGTSYYVYYADRTGGDNGTTYSKPVFEPGARAYFYIKFVTGSEANPYVNSILTKEQREHGFWISGYGSDAAQALIDACSTLRARGNSGFELNINDDPDNTLYGWLGSFIGLEDDSSPGGGLWDNWSQFSWNFSTSTWEYNNWCLGYYDPGVAPYFAVVRQITEDEHATAGVTATPSDIPSQVKSDSCTVRFVDGDGKTIKTQSVPYFGSATAPSNPTKSPSDGLTYTFTGWDREFDQVVTDITVTAQFASSGTDPGEPEEPDVPGDEGVHVTGVSISGPGTMIAGETVRFTATVTPANAEDRSVQWSSSDTSVATVDAGGNVSAVSEGTVTITVTTVDGGKTHSVTIVVEASAGTIDLKADFVALAKDECFELSLEKDPAISWHSDSPDVVTVNQNGLVTAVGDSGTALITARLGNVTATCTVSVISEETADELVSRDTSDEGGTSFSDSFTASHLDLIRDRGQGYTHIWNAGSIHLSDSVFDVIREDVILSVASVEPTPQQADKVGDSELFEFTITRDDFEREPISDLGGTATITIPFTLPAGASADDVMVYCIDIWGEVSEEIECTYSDGQVTFETTHFSLYYASVEGADPKPSEDEGSGTMLYIGIAVVIIAIIAVLAVLLMRRHA